MNQCLFVLVAGVLLAPDPTAQTLSRAEDIQPDARETPDAMPAPPGMVYVPGGETVMGTELKEVERLAERTQAKMLQFADEFPRHTVQVEPFFIDEVEVTNLQWKTFLDATGRQPSEWVVDHSWGGPVYADDQKDYPITNVNIPEIQEFLEWSGRRLPTEAEWVRAARGDDDRDWPWGDRWDRNVAQTGHSVPRQPVAVGSFPGGASPFGVLDMIGNVFEWVDSGYSAYEDFAPIPFKIGRKKEMITPIFNRTWRVAKGGSFVNTREVARIDYREGLAPTSSDVALGFRCARSLVPGADAIRHAYDRLLPSMLPRFEDLDLSATAIAGHAHTEYDTDHFVIGGYEYLWFAPPMPKRMTSLSRLRRSSVDEPVVLGLITSSEPLAEPPLPAGEYLLAYKGKGESKEHRERRRAERRSGSRNEPPEPTPLPVDSGGGAAAPWPGVAVNDIVEDIDFPQDKEVILFHNVNSAVVGWIPAGEIVEKDKADSTATSSDGVTWTISFSLDNLPRNGKMPRFSFPITLHGDGLTR